MKRYKGPAPSYFLPSHFDYPPEGPIKLGNLISDLNDPGNPLNQADRIPIKEEMRMPVTEVERFKGGVKDSNDRELGLCAKAIYHIGLQAHLGLTESDARTFSATLSRLQTHAIMPDDDYVERAMMTAEVQSKLKSRLLFRKPIFMITALKIAYPAPPRSKDDEGNDDDAGTLGTNNSSSGRDDDEARDIIHTEWDDQSTIEGSIHASGSVSGVPVAVEAKAKKQRKSNIPASFVPVTPFVYAFAVRQCFYSWKKKPQRHRPYTKGALASHNAKDHARAASTSLKDEGEDPEEMEFSFLEVAEDTLDADNALDL